MTDSPSAEVRSIFWRSSQWAKGVFFRKEGEKNRIVISAVFAVVGIMLSAALTVEIFRSIGTKEVVDGAKFAIGELGDFFDLPQYDELGDRRTPDSGVRPMLVHQAPRLAGPKILISSGPRGLIPGTVIKAQLLGGSSNGLIRAQVSAADGARGAVNVGDLLIGEASSDEQRLHIHFQQVVNKDGIAAPMNGEACDPSDQSLGVKGENANSHLRDWAAAVGLSFVAGLSDGLRTRGSNGDENIRPTLRDGLLNGTAEASLRQSQVIIQDLKSQKPKIEITKGTEICVVLMGT